MAYMIKDTSLSRIKFVRNISKTLKRIKGKNMSKVTNVDESTFTEQVEQSTVPVLVEFGASWCGPCRRQLPILESVAETYQNQLKVVKIDVDDAPQLSSNFSIKSVPTLMIFNHGQVLHSASGLANLDVVKSVFLSKVGI